MSGKTNQPVTSDKKPFPVQWVLYASDQNQQYPLIVRFLFAYFAFNSLYSNRNKKEEQAIKDFVYKNFDDDYIVSIKTYMNYVGCKERLDFLDSKENLIEFVISIYKTRSRTLHAKTNQILPEYLQKSFYLLLIISMLYCNNRSIYEYNKPCFCIDTILDSIEFKPTAEDCYYPATALFKIANKSNDQKLKFLCLYIILDLFANEYARSNNCISDESIMIFRFAENHDNCINDEILDLFGTDGLDNQGTLIKKEGEINKRRIGNHFQYCGVPDDLKPENIELMKDLNENRKNIDEFKEMLSDRYQVYVNLMLRPNSGEGRKEKTKALFMTIYYIRRNFCHGEKCLFDIGTSNSERDNALIEEAAMVLQNIVTNIIDSKNSCFISSPSVQ